MQALWLKLLALCSTTQHAKHLGPSVADDITQCRAGMSKWVHYSPYFLLLYSEYFSSFFGQSDSILLHEKEEAGQGHRRELCPWTWIFVRNCSSQGPNEPSHSSRWSFLQSPNADHPSYSVPLPGADADTSRCLCRCMSPVQSHGGGMMSNWAVPRLFTEWRLDLQGRVSYQSYISHFVLTELLITV